MAILHLTLSNGEPLFLRSNLIECVGTIRDPDKKRDRIVTKVDTKDSAFAVVDNTAAVAHLWAKAEGVDLLRVEQKP